MTVSSPSMLTNTRGVALYVGALIGPGLLILPGLAASIAGPASVLAWIGLLGLSALFAVVFAAFGTRLPGASGVVAYAAAAFGARVAAATGACFLTGVVLGAPVVCLVGGGYLADVTGTGRTGTVAAAAVLLLLVLAITLCGARATTTVQLVLVAVLLVVSVLAVAGSAPSARASNWTPFAPHGWTSLGSAASVLMLSFVGWEAIAPLASRFADPRRQLPRVIAIAFLITALVYLGLAVATISVLGGSGSDVPLADLLQVALGPAGRAVAAWAAVVLTLGTTNAYLTGALALARELRANRRPEAVGSGRGMLAAIAVTGLGMLALNGAELVSTAQLVTVPTTLFLVVYLACTAAGSRVLHGGARVASTASLMIVLAVLAFCSPRALAVAALVAVVAYRRSAMRNSMRGSPGSTGCASPVATKPSRTYAMRAGSLPSTTHSRSSVAPSVRAHPATAAMSRPANPRPRASGVTHIATSSRSSAEPSGSRHPAASPIGAPPTNAR